MATYAIAPHLQQNVPAPEQFTKGLQLGTQLREAEQRLQVEASIAATNAQIKREQMQMQAMLDAQRLEVDAAYKNQMIEMEREKVKAAQEYNALRTEEAAQRLQAQAAYTARAKEVGSLQAALELGPALGMSGRDMADLSEAVTPFTPKPATVEEYGGEKFLKVPRPRGMDIYQHIPREQEVVAPGDARAYPMPDESGKPVPGWKLFPSSGGGLRPIRVEDEEFNRVNEELKRMEAGMMGRYLERGEPNESWSDKVKAEFKKKLDRYQWLQNRYEELSVGPQKSTPGVDYEAELKLAREALSRRVPRDKVAARFKQRTGKDFPND